MRKCVVLAICLTVGLAMPAMAQQAKPESIKKLLQVSGDGDLGVQMMNQMIPALKNMIPDAPPAFWDDVMQQVNAEELENLLIPVYQKHLTEADVKALNEFYASDVGQKMIKTQPAIMRESMMLGQQWGQQLAQKIVQRYEAQKAK